MNDYQAGQKLLGGGYSAYTPTGKSYLVQKKRSGKIPHRGDIVYFYTSSKGRVSHVGIVENVSLRNGLYYIDTLEGNTNAGVLFERDGGEFARKHYEFLPSQVGGTNRINCFCTPLFDADTCSAEQFVQAALDQLGYIEKASNGTDEQLQNKTWNPGNKNYTWFGKWYGLNPAEWCQMSVSHIAYLACKYARNHKTGWEEIDDFWYYWRSDGTQVIAEWEYIGGRWYVFDEMGRMIKGWFRSGNDWYMMGEDGGMLAGQWIWDGDKSYYLTKSGIMAKNAYVRSDKAFAPGQYIYYWVNSRGEWEPKWDTEKPDLVKCDLAE